MSTKSILSTLNDELCLGCGTCFSICPESAINVSMMPSRGLYLPRVNQEICIKCGKCYQACPGHSVDFEQFNLDLFDKGTKSDLIGCYKDCYTGYTNDSDIRFNSTSGGMVTEVLLFALERGLITGALVSRMSKTDPLEPEPFIARTKGEIIEASKSKYCPIPVNIALKQILDSEDEKVAVVGLPCHIQGIRKAEIIDDKLKKKIVLHLGLFCGRCPSYTGTEFLLRVAGVDKGDIVRIDYRGGGWPSGTTIILNDRNKMIIPYGIAWSIISLFLPSRCMLCYDGACELADISFADAWFTGLNNDKMGSSIIVARSNSGDQILRKMASFSDIELNLIDASEITTLSHKSMLSFKKVSIFARIHIFKLIGKSTPKYNQISSYPSLSDYFSTIRLLFMNFLVERRILWSYLIFLFRLMIYLKKRYIFTKRNNDD